MVYGSSLAGPGINFINLSNVKNKKFLSTAEAAPSQYLQAEPGDTDSPEKTQMVSYVR